jgi:hypothetical protein
MNVIQRKRTLARFEGKLDRIQSLIDKGGWHLNWITIFRLNSVCRNIQKLDAEPKPVNEEEK